MSQEIIKRVGTRAYRYRVDRIRDPQTGRSRSKWTYLGRLMEGAPPPVHHRATATRMRLIEALERVLERVEYADLTADAVAHEAGVAHGTFYRYFKDKREAVRAALDRVKEIIDREAPSFEAKVGSREEERRRVRAWVESVLHAPVERAGLLRAWYELVNTDTEVRALRDARREAHRAVFGAYLDRLAAAAIIGAAPEPGFTGALLSLFDAVFRSVAIERFVIDQERIDGVTAVFDRAIFGPEVLPHLTKASPFP